MNVSYPNGSYLQQPVPDSAATADFLPAIPEGTLVIPPATKDFVVYPGTQDFYVHPATSGFIVELETGLMINLSA